MKINKNHTVAEIKAEFRSKYPFLKIEFYSKGHGHFKGSLGKDLLKDELLLSEINPEFNKAEVSIEPETTVDEFETSMKNLGFNIQVFRKSANQWLQTSVTDNWALGKQEQKAERSESLSNK